MNFLHEEIVIPTLVKDSVSLWIRNNFRKTLISGSPLRSFTMTLWDNINGDTLGTTFNAAQRDVEALRTDLIKGSISPLVALSSLKLSPDTTFTQYYLELGKNSIPSPDSTQPWATCILHLSWWEMILVTTSLSKLPEVISFERDVKREIYHWVRSEVWNNISNSLPYRETIRTRLVGMYEYLNKR